MSNLVWKWWSSLRKLMQSLQIQMIDMSKQETSETRETETESEREHGDKVAQSLASLA